MGEHPEILFFMALDLADSLEINLQEKASCLASIIEGWGHDFELFIP